MLAVWGANHPSFGFDAGKNLYGKKERGESGETRGRGMEKDEKNMGRLIADVVDRDKTPRNTLSAQKRKGR